MIRKVWVRVTVSEGFLEMSATRMKELYADLGRLGDPRGEDGRGEDRRGDVMVAAPNRVAVKVEEMLLWLDG